MTVTLAATIDDTTHALSLSDPVDVEPGDLRLLEDEIVQVIGYRTQRNPRLLDKSKVQVIRGVQQTTRAAHASGTELLGVADAFVAGDDEAEPSPFAASPGGGSSTAGAWITADFIFTEVDVAGIYTATLNIPAGGWLLDAFLIPETDVWASTGATINVGDSDAPDDIFDDQGLDGGGTNAAYDPHAGTQTSGNSYLGVSTAAGKYGVAVYSARNGTYNGTGNAPGIPYPTGDTITMEVVTTHMDTVVPTGVLRVRLIYTVPVEADADFVAA